MKRYKYPFVDSRPYLPVSIVNPSNNKIVYKLGLIDTGADACLFSKEIVNGLSHNLKASGVKSDVTSGIEGKDVTTWKHSFILCLLHPQVLLQPNSGIKIVWRSKKLLVECVDHSDLPELLGTKDFLKNFKVTIDYHSECTIIEW